MRAGEEEQTQKQRQRFIDAPTMSTTTVTKDAATSPTGIRDITEGDWPTPALPTPKLPAVPSPKLPSIPALPLPSTPTTSTPLTSSLPPSPLSSAKTPDATRLMTENTQWNTHKLGMRVGIDAVAAASAGVLVAPLITMIDKGIIENASGRCSLKESLKTSFWELARRPLGFLTGRPFCLILTLYFGTYFTANTIDTASTTLSPPTPSPSYTQTTSGTAKFVATSTSNLALCLYKDSRFTQLFGSATSAKRPVPLPTFALFTIRDCLTIFASFNLPPLLAPHLDRQMSDGVRAYVSSASVAQFATPAAVQVFSTPLHLLGLDLYNRPNAAMRKVPVWGPDGRVQRVVRDWGMSAIARMGRIVPAFGVGGVVNAKVRRGLMARVE